VFVYCTAEEKQDKKVKIQIKVIDNGLGISEEE
jgi:signal transduction histidine kinase